MTVDIAVRKDKFILIQNEKNGKALSFSPPQCMSHKNISLGGE